MSARRWWRRAADWIVYRLDQFVGWSPLLQIPALFVLTAVLVLAWTAVGGLLGEPAGDRAWWTLTRFLDGGTMAADQGAGVRALAVGVTVSGVMLVSLVIGAVSAKLSERIDDLRRGTSAIAAREHVLVLGFDAKVPLIARELARARRRMTLVAMSTEDKARVELLFRSALRVPRGRLRAVARTGDPRSELALARVAAERARCIVVVPPQSLDDEAAMRWTLSVLLAIRRATAGQFDGPIVVEARRAAHVPVLSLAGEAGLAGDGHLRIHVIASDDIVARVLAQSIRHGAVYLALRELISFVGHELYLEPAPPELVGCTFEEAHARVDGGVVVGVRRLVGPHLLAPPRAEDSPVIGMGDELVVLEPHAGALRGGGRLPPPPSVDRLQIDAGELPQVVAVLGGNRTLGCLIGELDAILVRGSVLRLSTPEPTEEERRAIEAAAARARNVRVEIGVRRAREVGAADDPALVDADGVVILGCDDPEDPDGDTSALALLLSLRRARRTGARPELRRLVTEVRDPLIARQIAGSMDDFLVSTDIVGMTVAHAAYDARLLPIYRELLDPSGAEIFVRPRRYYVPDGPATFALVMAAARRRGDVAIGYYVDGDRAREPELGSPVRLSPPRDAPVPEEGAHIVVIGHPR